MMSQRSHNYNPLRRGNSSYLRRSHGFTLIEVLIVITIIGILFTLSLPALQKAREAARNAHCKSNLRNIGLGLHTHYTVKGAFPVGYFYPPPEKENGGKDATWITFLLPYIEEQALYDKIDWTQEFGSAAMGPEYPNRDVTSAPLKLFTCPSSGTKGGLAIGKGYMRGTYAGNNGFGPMQESTPDDLPIQRDGGMFFLNGKVTFAKIQDGSSKTAMVSELRLVSELKFGPSEDWRGVLHYPEGPLYHHNFVPNSLEVDRMREPSCKSMPDAPCKITFQSWDDRDFLLTARSYHVGGVNLLRADGGVQFIDELIDAKAWTALGTLKGAELDYVNSIDAAR